jgi:hypothetical protein
VEVQVPGLPVVSFEFGAGAGPDEQRVDPPGGVIDGAGAGGLEDAAQFRGHKAELVGFFLGGRAATGRAQHSAETVERSLDRNK